MVNISLAATDSTRFPKVPTGKEADYSDTPALLPAKVSSSLPAAPALQQEQNEIQLGPNDVDEMAHAIDVPELTLPADADSGAGWVRIRVLIDEFGKSTGVEIDETTLPSDIASLLANRFLEATFSPARLGGKPVGSWRLIEILYGELDQSEKTEGLTKPAIID